MIPEYNISVAEEKEMALKRLKFFCDNNYISVFDFHKNPLKVFMAHELASAIDSSMATKMTVQFDLFGGTLLKLGTGRHQQVIKVSSVMLFLLGSFVVSQFIEMQIYGKS